jgi:hypothetical protein
VFVTLTYVLNKTLLFFYLHYLLILIKYSMLYVFFCPQVRCVMLPSFHTLNVYKQEYISTFNYEGKTPL